MIEEFDLMEFSALSKDRKDACRMILDELRSDSYDYEARQSLIRALFTYIAPQANIDVLMSATKDFNLLSTSLRDCENGLHSVRSYIAHMMADRRRRRNGYQYEETIVYDRLGLINYIDFLPEDLHKAITEEMSSYPLATELAQSRPLTRATKEVVELGFKLDSAHEKGLYTSVLDCLGTGIYNHEVNGLYRGRTFVQKLHNRRGDGDVQKVLHQDTFFPALKFWYFPEAVTEASGPFRYAVGSHLLTRKRVEYVYNESVRIASGSALEYSKDHGEGSIRITPEKLHEIGFEDKSYPVPANTLVIANVFGFHARAEVQEEGFRNSIHGSIRISKPFM